jgi:hypothetical protein
MDAAVATAVPYIRNPAAHHGRRSLIGGPTRSGRPAPLESSSGAQG